MTKVYNWQLGRKMSYPYEEQHPAVAVRLRLQSQSLHRLPDLHDGLQEHLDLFQGTGTVLVEQRREQALRRLSAELGQQAAEHARSRPTPANRFGTLPRRSARQKPYGTFEGMTIFEAAEKQPGPEGPQAGARLSADRRRVAAPQHPRGHGHRRAVHAGRPVRRFGAVARAQGLVLSPGSDLQSLHLSRLPGLLSATGDLQAARGRHRADRSEPLPRLSQVRRGLPVQEGHVPAHHAHQREVRGLLSADRGKGSDRSARPARRPRLAAWRPAWARFACKGW